MAGMNRRDFLRRSALVATGAIAADQLEILERLTHRRRFFPSADVGNAYADQHGRMWTARIVAVDYNRKTIDVEWNDAPWNGGSDSIILANSVEGFNPGSYIGLMRP